MARIRITNRAKKSIRNLYLISTSKSIQRRKETKSLVDAMIQLVNTTPLVISRENGGVLSIWRNKGYSIYESTQCFIRYSSGIRCKPMVSKKSLKRKWYFACVVDIRRDTLYVVNAVFAKYIDDDTPTAIKFMNAMKGVYTRKNKQEAERGQLKIQFPENESKLNELYNIMNNTKKRIRLTELDLHRIVKQVLKEGFGDNETIDMHRANTKRSKREFDKMDRESNGEPTPQMDSAAWEFYNRPNAAQDFEHFPRRSSVRDHNYDSLTLIPIEKRLEDYKRKKHYKYDDIPELDCFDDPRLRTTVSDLIKPLSDIDESIRRAIRKVLC